MSAANPDNRNSGIPSTGPLPWGSTFCQFYRTRKDLLDVLVPYFRAGLENNESCLWVTSGVLREADAEKALKKAVAGFGSRAAAGQVAIVPSSRWLARGGRSGRAILSRLDKAIGDGFDGLRLACEAVPAGNGATGLVPCGARVIAGKNVVAAFAYPAGGFDALGIMDVIKDHRFALVRSAGRWEVIESSEARTARAAQRRSDEKLKSLFQNMSEGFAYHRILLDPRGRPCDFVFLQINDAFRRLTGLRAKDIIGKRATVAIPGLDKDPADWIGKYGKVAMTGEPVRFESYSEPLKRWYVVSAFSPHKGYFAVTFNDITERKLAEETVRLRTVTLDGINRVFRETMTSSTEEEFGRKCLAVAEKVTRSRSGFIAEIGPDGLLHDVAISDPGWSLCRMEDKGGHRRLPGTFEIRGLYGRVIRDGKGFFTNDPASHPDSVGTPQGHPPLSAFLGVPMIHRGRTIGVVGVANREGGYRAEDLEALEALVAAISRSLMHRRAEEKIFETGQRLEGLMKALPVGVSFSDDATCQRITGNPTALAQFEIRAEDNLSASAPDGSAAGRRLRYFDRGRTLSDTELPLQRAVSENRDIPPTELEVELPSGRRWSMEASAAPLRDRRGNVIGGVAVTLDISGRKRAEEALRRAKEDWEQTFNTVPDLIAILDSDHRIIRVNKAMAD
ncbi:MAG: GAF domain-containing protein, partial [Deltaproteobacteria bacterium]